MVDRFCKTKLVDASLQTAFEEVFNLEGKHVIEFHAGFIEHTDSNQSADKGISFEESLGVFLVESEQLT